MSRLDEKLYIEKSLQGLDFSGETFSSIEFDNCSFTECNFSEAIFNKCNFIDCHFIKCNLSIIKILTSRFTDITFEQCKVIGVNWTKALWPNFELSTSMKFQQCIINDSSFFALNLQELQIIECKAHDVDFREGDFTQANFSHSDFSYSQFMHTNLCQVDFTQASNYQIDITCNEVKGAKFSRFEALNLLTSLGIELVD